MNDSYYQDYFKYKNKYLSLKSQSGGMKKEDKDKTLYQNMMKVEKDGYVYGQTHEERIVKFNWSEYEKMFYVTYEKKDDKKVLARVDVRDFAYSKKDNLLGIFGENLTLDERKAIQKKDKEWYKKEFPYGKPKPIKLGFANPSPEEAARLEEWVNIIRSAARRFKLNNYTNLKRYSKWHVDYFKKVFEESYDETIRLVNAAKYKDFGI